MSLSLSKTFLHSQWYQILHWSQQILCIFFFFELIFNFSSSTFWQVSLNYNGLIASNLVAKIEINRYFFPICFIFSHNLYKWIFCSPNYKISLIWLRELYLWNNLYVILLMVISPLSVERKEHLSIFSLMNELCILFGHLTSRIIFPGHLQYIIPSGEAPV